MLNIHQSSYNLFQQKTKIIWKEEGRCAVIDPGFSNEAEEKDFFSFLEARALVPEAVLLTHGHIDHIYGVKRVQDRYGIPVYMHPADKPVLETSRETAAQLGISVPDISFTATDIAEGDIIETAGISLEVIWTPGHTPGGVCYLDREDRILFSGDTLFAGTIGRTDFRYSEYDDEIRSIMEKLVIIDGDIALYPGHGQESTIGWERTHNPFLEPFNEPEEELDPDAEPIIIRG